MNFMITNQPRRSVMKAATAMPKRNRWQTRLKCLGAKRRVAATARWQKGFNTVIILCKQQGSYALQKDS